MPQQNRPASFYIIIAGVTILLAMILYGLFGRALHTNAIGFRVYGMDLGFKASELLRPAALLLLTVLFGILFLRAWSAKYLALTLAAGIAFLLLGSRFSMGWTSYPPMYTPPPRRLDPAAIFEFVFYLKVLTGIFMGGLVALAILRGPVHIARS